ncbi:SAF domain-containing protein [Leekyejoonella antrihumi]|uniref:SAF domain-containing protein n=1 Tax=Leekyejoonella antrihumi TaxID=1660198 RepID=A0A563E8J1_9MICO|nr:SAF domain-containing protein [Leekyejoonella antrihumi]TWP38629.1 hypothetical protein FGL98_02255 [Leekyejoonella antrihumi]
MNRLDRLLPDGWQGRSREARWRRSRARRVLAAGVAAGAVLVGWNALAPRASATRSITVAIHDLPAGHVLTRADLTTAQWPESVQLPGAITARAAAGQALTAPVGHGEPVTRSRVRAARTWPGASAGQVLVGVPVSNPTVAAVTRPGDHVDVFAGGKTSPIGTDLLVISTTRHAAGATDRSPLVGAGGAESPPALLVACSVQTAARLAQATQLTPGGDKNIFLALHPAP